MLHPKTIQRNAAVFLFAGLAACTRSTQTQSPTAKPTQDPTYAGDEIVIAKMTLDQTMATLMIDQVKSKGNLSHNCNSVIAGAVGSKPCQCRFSWRDIGGPAEARVSIPRTLKTAITQLSDAGVTCSVPAADWDRIYHGTPVRVSIVAAKQSVGKNLFTTGLYLYLKGSEETVVAGDFSDAQGHLFDTVLRYACFKKSRASLEIKSKLIPQKLGTPLATQFSRSTPADSAQAYYYNFYIKKSERTTYLNQSDGYVCPAVKETAKVGAATEPWPFDATFALARSRDPDFNVPVESRGLLGYAMHPKDNGTCAALKSTDGSLRGTYRLRRFVSIFPPRYDADGSVLSDLKAEPQSSDAVYVLDRPVKGPSAFLPYTMYGPKPCPIAYLDRKNVTLSPVPGYVASSDAAWNGKNRDGTEFPNSDLDPNVCSAALPLLSPDHLTIGLTTVNRMSNSLHSFSHVYVRPLAAFVPHYEEDTQFQACAPQPDIQVDPPLHFSRNPNSGNIAWCAETVPTQNPQLTAVDPAASGLIPPFTSHLVSRSGSAPCTASALPIPINSAGIYPYPALPGAQVGYAYHSKVTLWESGHADQTCDRTAVAADGPEGKDLGSVFPLLARARDVESLLNLDSSYSCQITFDNGGAKAGHQSPTSGCCDLKSVMLPTGGDAPLSAHLEPDIVCQSPDY